MWQKAGLDTMEKEEAIAFCEKLFAKYLDGHALMSNASHLRGSAQWIKFPRVVCQSWVHHNGNAPVVLMGDAAHTAHFSIGSGTRLAIEDAIALTKALEAETEISAGLARYQAERKPIVQKLVTAARTSSRTNVAELREKTPLHVFFFDALRVDGADLLDLPYSERQEVLARTVPPGLLTPRLVTSDVAEAEKFFTDVVRAGHEGLVVKSLPSPYAAGRRGAGWIKVKPRHTLDLVVLAAEWGHGRREGKLSNLHLGARDPETGGFVMLGKTFKGMTDALLEWQTRELLAREVARSGHVVHVRPELVVEVGYDQVTGDRLRHGSRLIRWRPDKAPRQCTFEQLEAEADRESVLVFEVDRGRAEGRGRLLHERRRAAGGRGHRVPVAQGVHRQGPAPRRHAHRADRRGRRHGDVRESKCRGDDGDVRRGWHLCAASGGQRWRGDGERRRDGHGDAGTGHRQRHRAAG